MWTLGAGNAMPIAAAARTDGAAMIDALHAMTADATAAIVSPVASMTTGTEGGAWDATTAALGRVAA